MSKRSGSVVASHMGMPLQVRPSYRSSDRMSGVPYKQATRSHLAGITNPAAHNERPFMTWKDEYRGAMGMHTWDPNMSPKRTGSYGRIHVVPNFGQAKIRAALSLRTSAHGTLHFNGQVPGKTPSNPSQTQGKRVLSSKFIPLETKGDGLLFIHPSQREILTWTQEQLRADAKAGGRDVDRELDEKIEDVLRHDPVQPYHDVAGKRRVLTKGARNDIINQEMRLHQRRKDKGLPVPPLLLPQYSNEYPDTPTGENSVPKLITWFHTREPGKYNQRFGSIVYNFAPDQLKRMKKRREQYSAELERQGIKVPRLPFVSDREEWPDQWRIAEMRNVKKHGTAPLEPEVIDATVLGDD